jgi:hypothetical protein
MDKSYVSMEQHVCMVCGVPFDTGNLLLDRRLRNSMETHTVTNWGLCPEHEKLHKEGFVALVEIDPERSGEHTLEGVWRTGNLCHLRREAAKKVINYPVDDLPLVFVEIGFIDKLRSMVKEQ